jgi:hypothetical protein
VRCAANTASLDDRIVAVDRDVTRDNRQAIWAGGICIVYNGQRNRRAGWQNDNVRAAPGDAASGCGIRFRGGDCIAQLARATLFEETKSRIKFDLGSRFLNLV